MKKLLPLILAVVGLGAGVGAGMAMRPAPQAATAAEADRHAEPSGDHSEAKGSHGQAGEGGDGAYDYVRLNNQFVVPVMRDARVVSLVVLALDLEVEHGTSETVFAVEPKLRDAFLTVLFDHANAGGFDGTFTASGAMTILRNALRESGQSVLGEVVHDVLITSIVRQEV